MGVMEKSWNSVFRFLWEPCTVRCLLTVKLNIIFFLVRLEFSTLPGGIILMLLLSQFICCFLSFWLRNIKTKVGKSFCFNMMFTVA